MAGYLTVREIAEIYGIHYETAREWCKKGLIKAKKIGKQWYIPKDNENLDEKA